MKKVIVVEEVVRQKHKRLEPMCNGPFSKLKFKRSREPEVEYVISGFCQSCQCELVYELKADYFTS